MANALSCMSENTEASVMKLLGWGDQSLPHFNNWSIRAMRFLAYDVVDLVAGE
jgi:hypothetical protein